MVQGGRPADAETASPPSTAEVPSGRAPRDTAVNLLFGLLALQNNFIDRDALVAAFNSWLAHRSRRLGEILAESGALSASRRAILDELVEEHLQLHGNAPEQSLAALGSIGAAGIALSQVADPEVRACLAWVLTSPDDEEERDRTTSYATLGASTSAGTRFQILRPHARGGLGEVFVALDTDLHREVALKEIQARFVDDPRHRERFEFEAVVTGGLEHPGIVPVYGAGPHAGWPAVLRHAVHPGEQPQGGHPAVLPGRGAARSRSRPERAGIPRVARAVHGRMRCHLLCA